MIRWITHNLGTAAWDSATSARDVTLLDTRDFLDRSGNNTGAVRARIEEGVNLLNAGRRVLVCCDYGISRSNAFAAGILTLSNGGPLRDAIRQVLLATGEKSIKLEVLAAVREAVGESHVIMPEVAGDRHNTLVTGATGFLAYGLVPELEVESVVVAPLRAEIDYEQDAVAFDLLLRERSIDTVLHLAHPRVYNTNESIGRALTILKNVVDACVGNGVRLVFLSSWEVFSGYRTTSLLADEALTPNPGSTYGMAKMLCEKLLEQSRRSAGLQCAVLRSGPVYGLMSDKPRFIWSFVRKAAVDEPIRTHLYKNGRPMLDLMHISDLQNAIVSVVNSNVTGVFNLGTGRPASTAEVARSVVAQLDSRSSISEVELDGFACNVVMDSSRAREVLGWKAVTDIHLGLKEVTDSV